MTSKHTQNSKDTKKSVQHSDAAIDSSASTPLEPSSPLTIDGLIEAQVTFMQQWLREQAEPLVADMWQWLGQQQLSHYISAKDLQRFINEGLLNQPVSEPMRADIRDILHTLIYHPVNDGVPLSELVDETQVHTLATYIGSHAQQRNILIHSFIGNDTFADLLTQTLYHAINDFMESTLDKAGGVGKLMKLGRSSFEKATNRNLDEKLQAYLHRNIKDLTRRAETNAQEHLSNEEVARLLITGWAGIKDQPVSQLQRYLNDDPESSSIQHIEASVQQSYNRLRLSPYLHTLVAAAVDTWYANHQSDSFATLISGLNLDVKAITQLNATLLLVTHDAIDSKWLTAYIRKILQAFYEQPTIKNGLAFSNV